VKRRTELLFKRHFIHKSSGLSDGLEFVNLAANDKLWCQRQLFSSIRTSMDESENLKCYCWNSRWNKFAVCPVRNPANFSAFILCWSFYFSP